MSALDWFPTDHETIYPHKAGDRLAGPIVSRQRTCRGRTKKVNLDADERGACLSLSS